MRNSDVLAIAPTYTISNIVGSVSRLSQPIRIYTSNLTYPANSHWSIPWRGKRTQGSVLYGIRSWVNDLKYYDGRLSAIAYSRGPEAESMRRLRLIPAG